MDRMKTPRLLATAALALAACLALAPATLAKPSGPSAGTCLDVDGNTSACDVALVKVVECAGADPIGRQVAALTVRDAGGRLRRVARGVARRHLCLVDAATPGTQASQSSSSSFWKRFAVIGVSTLVGLSLLLSLWQRFSARTQDPPIADELAGLYARGDRVEVCARPVNCWGFTRASQLWVATDKRLLLAWRKPRWDTDRLIESVEYRAITAIRKVKVDSGEGADATTIVLDLGFQELTLKIRNKPAKRLLAVLSQQAGLEAPPRRRWRWW